MATFINCSSTQNDLSTVLDILENNSDLLLTGVDAVVDVLNDFVADEVMSSTSEIDDAIRSVDDGIISIIPDYTDRFNNTAEALNRYDEDFAAFKQLLKECPQAQLPEFLKTLDLGFDLPDLPDIDLPFFDSSQIREALRDITEFPLTYLNSVKGDILAVTKGGINDLAGGVKEFLTSTGLDDIEDLIPDKITDVAQRAEYLLNCAQKIKCSSLVQNIERYESIMSPLPLDPPFQLTTFDKVAQVPRYGLNTPGILATSTAGPQQITNVENAKVSYTNAMTYARTITSKF
jgi:hypothetical protein